MKIKIVCWLVLLSGFFFFLPLTFYLYWRDSYGYPNSLMEGTIIFTSVFLFYFLGALFAFRDISSDPKGLKRANIFFGIFILALVSAWTGKILSPLDSKARVLLELLENLIIFGFYIFMSGFYLIIFSHKKNN